MLMKRTRHRLLAQNPSSCVSFFDGDQRPAKLNPAPRARWPALPQALIPIRKHPLTDEAIVAQHARHAFSMEAPKVEINCNSRRLLRAHLLLPQQRRCTADELPGRGHLGHSNRRAVFGQNLPRSAPSPTGRKPTLQPGAVTRRSFVILSPTVGGDASSAASLKSALDAGESVGHPRSNGMLRGDQASLEPLRAR